MTTPDKLSVGYTMADLEAFIKGRLEIGVSDLGPINLATQLADTMRELQNTNDNLVYVRTEAEKIMRGNEQLRELLKKCRTAILIEQRRDDLITDEQMLFVDGIMGEICDAVNSNKDSK